MGQQTPTLTILSQLHGGETYNEHILNVSYIYNVHDYGKYSGTKLNHHFLTTSLTLLFALCSIYVHPNLSNEADNDQNCAAKIQCVKTQTEFSIKHNNKKIRDEPSSLSLK